MTRTRLIVDISKELHSKLKHEAIDRDISLKKLVTEKLERKVESIYD